MIKGKKIRTEKDKRLNEFGKDIKMVNLTDLGMICKFLFIPWLRNVFQDISPFFKHR
jgi:hypothetical protein